MNYKEQLQEEIFDIEEIEVTELEEIFENERLYVLEEKVEFYRNYY